MSTPHGFGSGGVSKAMKRAISMALLVVGLPADIAVRAAEAAKPFETPEAAVTALSAAVQASDPALLRTLFGPAAQQLVNPDAIQGNAELSEFAEALTAGYQLARDSDARITLEVGTQAWPFPIPIVKDTRGWYFDTEAGLEELLNRRIGRNELDVLRVMRAYVEAQREYASQDRDGDEVLEYAQRITSTEGQTDGLFWPPDLNGEISPLGPAVARAQTEGYFADPLDDRPQPFHGYFFKILTRQTDHAPGGAYDYVINGHMIGGFALVGWPAQYGESGIMTFTVNQRGRVYQRDLGHDTTRIVRDLTSYDPGPEWQVSPD